MKLEKVISTVLICLTILVGTYFLSQSSFSVKNTDLQRVNETTVTNSIAVQGQGKVYATPDTAILRFRISSLKKTSAEAQKAVDTGLEKFKKVMAENDIEKKNIQTQNIIIDTDYDHRYDERKLRGYRASHSIKVIVRDIQDKNKATVGKIVNAVSQMGDMVSIEGMHYDIWDKTDFYTEARKLAMKKANQKIDELAGLAGVNKDKPLAISEQTHSSSPYFRYNMMSQNFAVQNQSSMDDGDDAYISLGTIEVIVNLNVVYGIK